MIPHFTLFLLLLFTVGCSNSDTPSESTLRRQNQKGEFVYRVHDEYLFVPPSPQWQARDSYPWEIGVVENLPRITKEFFRCKGSCLNSEQVAANGDEIVRLNDCGGLDRHGLPLHNNKEFIYPVLIDLMNYLQTRTEKRVIITSGHRCPQHNTYVDPSYYNRTSKHLIGAEVSFYVQGMEYLAETIAHYLQDYYRAHFDQPDYAVFKRYEKNDTNVSTQPWYNKEIFIKLFKKDEGHNFDNRHPYPYVSIQVRYDRELDQRVFYTWEAAHQQYLRK